MIGACICIMLVWICFSRDDSQVLLTYLNDLW